MQVVVQTDGLSQGYGRRTVIRDVSLSLGSGVHGLLGPNGAGKTTLLTTVATVAPPRAGRLSLLGREIRTARDARSARAALGFLPQGFSFAPRFTVQDFLEYVAWTKKMPRASIASAVDDALERCDMLPHRSTRLGALSGGMLQRAGIAQALVNRPEVLLLDEPTVGLDPEQRLTFRNLLAGLCDMTVILSTHLVEDISATCQRVLVLHDGTLTFDGDVEALSALGRGGTGSTGGSDLERGYLRAIRPPAVPA